MIPFSPFPKSTTLPAPLPKIGGSFGTHFIEFVREPQKTNQEKKKKKKKRMQTKNLYLVDFRKSKQKKN